MSPSKLLILSGNPLKAVLQTLTVFVLLLALCGSVLVGSVVNSLKDELAAQIIEESLLLQTIYREKGLSGLQQSLQQLSSSERIADVFDADGVSLVGNIDTLPTVAVEQQQLFLFRTRHNEARYWGYALRLERQTLIVGRSDNVIAAAKWRLILGLVLSGLIFIVFSLLIGYIFSRRSAAKLTQFEQTLTHVADGDAAARLPVAQPPEQIDLVAEKMNLQLARLQRLMNTMNNTGKAIAHDLKTPLSRAQIALLEALDACDNGENPADYVQQALDENRHLNDVFETLLRISRLQTQVADKSQFTRFNVRSMLADCVAFLSPNAEQNAQQLHLDCPDDLSFVADKDMLQQAIINLINNAVVHSGQHTTITVTAQVTDNHCVLQVCDTGKGIAKADREKVLEPFARLDTARTTEGNGLGLALVNAIADHHSGNIRLQDNTPSGLCVVLCLPSQ